MESPGQNELFNTPDDRAGGTGLPEPDNLKRRFLIKPPSLIQPPSPSEPFIPNAVSSVHQTKVPEEPRSRVIGKMGFDYEQLTENGLKLYDLLLGEIGINQYLPELAKMTGIDLEEGLKELRKHELLDESDPTITLIVSREL